MTDAQALIVSARLSAVSEFVAAGFALPEAVRLAAMVEAVAHLSEEDYHRAACGAIQAVVVLGVQDVDGRRRVLYMPFLEAESVPDDDAGILERARRMLPCGSWRVTARIVYHF